MLEASKVPVEAASDLSAGEKVRAERALAEWTQVARQAPAHAMSVGWSVVSAAFLGGMLGVIAFAIEKAAGFLDHPGEPWSWMVWLLVPAYALAGGGLFTYYGVQRGWSRVTRKLIFDSGLAKRILDAVVGPLLRMLPEQNIQDVRGMQERLDELCQRAVDEAARDSDRTDGMSGVAAWIKRRFLRLVRPLLAKVVRAAVAKGATTLEALTGMRESLVIRLVDQARANLDDMFARTRNLTLGFLIVVCAIPPILLQSLSASPARGNAHVAHVSAPYDARRAEIRRTNEERTKAMTASVTTSEGRHTLRMERPLAHSVEEVWRAITDPQRLSAWWPMQIEEIPLEVGATLHFHDEAGTPAPGAITELEPGRILGFQNEAGDHAVRLELVPDPRGCVLVFTHSFDAGTAPAQHATGWHSCFDALEALLDGRPVPPLGYDPALRRHYDEALGTEDSE